jgi:sialic acid synthase SpsE/sugar phosphate isomerase/epimerase
MMITLNLADYIVFSEDSLLNALRKITNNKIRLVFSVTESGMLEGVLTDGDFRRWLTDGNEANLEIPVHSVSNKKFVSLLNETKHEDIEKLFNSRVAAIPLLDKHQHLVAIALQNSSEFRIGKFIISPDQPAFVIAEIGNNHNGSLDLAKKLVDEAVKAGADCAKFQMRSMSELYRTSDEGSDISEDLGTQYTLDLLSRFQLKTEELFLIFDYCKTQDIVPLCTPWDKESLALLEGYGMQAYKLASADLSNHELIDAMAKTGKPLICSTGMSNEAEIIDAVKLLKKLNVNYILLHCNSTYPAPFKDINLNYMERLSQIGDCIVGYSGHERGVAVAISAVAKGAKVIEKHFTIDSTMVGNDHRVSLLPDEFKMLVEGIREVEEALGISEPRRLTQGELMNREILGKSLIINCSLREGETITSEMIDIRSPGKGLPPYRKNELIGRVAKKDFIAGDFFYASDIDADSIKPRAYSFKRPFGIPVRYHDVQAMSKLSNFDLLEFHMSYKDLDEPPEKYLNESSHLHLVVHSPELFAGDHIMDLCSTDKDYRNRSISELQRVINLTRRLKKFFPKTERPLIIINAGGFSMDRFLDAKDRPFIHEMIADSLANLDQDGVEIIPQTMPPFPWHFGGQRYHNAFVLPEDIEVFCKTYKYRICLDISHSQLASNYYGLSFKDFLNTIGKYAAHIHIVDAEGVDGEGLQIGDGVIDFGMVGETLDLVSAQASFIPEVWQGHKNNGEGFWVALDRLEKWI